MNKFLQIVHKVIGTTESICQFLIDLIPEKPKTSFDAKFMPISKVGSRFNKGFSLNGLVALTRKQSFENVSLFGPTGSGKTSTIILGSAFSLARGKSSIVFNDISLEQWEKFSRPASKTHNVMRIDFSDASKSQSFNPLARCKTISDINKVANLILKNALGGGNGDPFWHISAVMLISIMARYLVFHSEPQYRTMQNILRMIEVFAVKPERIDALFVKVDDEELRQSYFALNASGQKTLQSILSVARASLSLFVDKEVCKTTATDSIDFKELRKGSRPVALFVCNPLQDIHYYKPLSALFFQTLFNEILSGKPDKGDYPIYIVLEEMATMQFPNFSTTISNCRKMNCGILICMQDEMSLIANYGQAEAHNIKTNTGTQIYLKGQPLHTCRELEQIMGKFTFEDDHGIHTRPLMTADEIRQSDDAIILVSNNPPIKAKMHPQYLNTWRRRQMNLPPYQLPSRSIVDPPLLPIP